MFFIYSRNYYRTIFCLFILIVLAIYSNEVSAQSRSDLPPPPPERIILANPNEPPRAPWQNPSRRRQDLYRMSDNSDHFQAGIGVAIRDQNAESGVITPSGITTPRVSLQRTLLLAEILARGGRQSTQFSNGQIRVLQLNGEIRGATNTTEFGLNGSILFAIEQSNPLLSRRFWQQNQTYQIDRCSPLWGFRLEANIDSRTISPRPTPSRIVAPLDLQMGGSVLVHLGFVCMMQTETRLYLTAGIGPTIDVMRMTPLSGTARAAITALRPGYYRLNTEFRQMLSGMPATAPSQWGWVISLTDLRFSAEALTSPLRTSVQDYLSFVFGSYTNVGYQYINFSQNLGTTPSGASLGSNYMSGGLFTAEAGIFMGGRWGSIDAANRNTH